MHLISLLVAILHERRERFGSGNDALWGAGRWVECARCPDSFGFPSFHSARLHESDVSEHEPSALGSPSTDA